MRVRLTCLACSILVAGSVPWLFGAATPGAPDENAFRNWHTTLRAQGILWGLTYGEGVWVGASGGPILYSMDASDWSTTQPSFIFQGFSGVTYGEGVFVGVARADMWSIAESTNGIDWRSQYSSFSFSVSMPTVAYGNGLFVAGSIGFVVATNNGLWGTSGLSWSPAPAHFYCYRLCFGGGKFVAAGARTNAAIATSTDGREWRVKEHPNTSADHLRGCTWRNGKFIVVGERGVILVSDDGENWTQPASPTTNNLFGVAAHDNQYVAVGSRVMLISTNGLDWEKLPLPEPNIFFTDVTVADNSFAASYYVDTPNGTSSAVYRSTPFNYAAPSFRGQPAHIEQKLGLATALIAAADGTWPITYQWQKNGVDMPGATSNVLAFLAIQRTDGATYRVVARNSMGETTSAEAVLRVGLPASVLDSPMTQSAPAGSTVTFSANIEGTAPLTNRWRKPGSIFVTQVVYEASSFLRVENVRAADAGTYGLISENKYGRTASRPATLTVLTDADADGLPDDWEQQNGVTDPAADSDDDGLTNLQEYQAGTDPNDPRSYLKVDQIELASGASAVLLRFLARSNHTYTIQACETLSSPTWTRALDVVAASSDRLVTATNELAGNQRFFRLTTPRID